MDDLNCGIYRIRNVLDNNFYIGQSFDFKKRKILHFNDLSRNKHSNRHLQFAFNKYGKNNFVFEILLYCEESELTYYEQKYVDILCPQYNICKLCVNSRKGVKSSEETKKKISANAKNQWGENNNRYGKRYTEEEKKQFSGKNSFNYGKKVTEEQKRMISEKNSGEKNGMYGKKHTEEARKKMSENRNKKEMSQETRRKISEKLTGRKASEESREKMRISSRKRWDKVKKDNVDGEKS